MVPLRDLFEAKKDKWLYLASMIVGSYSMSKKVRKIRLASANGDVHFIFEDSFSSKLTNGKDECDEFEARKFSKREASKPLFIAHE